MCMYLNVCHCMLAVSLGCVHDDVRAEPGSWMVVGMIPVFDKKKATRGKGPTEDGPNGPATRRAEDGPNGAARRRISLTHQCLSALLEGWNALTEHNKIIQWADEGHASCSRASSWTSPRPTPTAAILHSPASCANARSTGCMSRSITPRNTHIRWRQRSCGQPTASILGRNRSFTATAVSGSLPPIAAKRRTSVGGRL